MDINVIGKSLYSWLIVTLERCKGIFLVNHKVWVNGTGYNCRGQKDEVVGARNELQTQTETPQILEIYHWNCH